MQRRRLSVADFCPVMLDKSKMTDEESSKFRANAESFVYSEPWIGRIEGYRSKDGRVLIDRCEPI